MARPIPEIEEELEARVDDLGLELVDLDWAGSDRRPILRIRVDFPDSRPGHGITVDDCADVSRKLEPWLDDHARLPATYVLEVSSPGVERPLKGRKDFVRFAGQEVAVKGDEILAGKATYLEGELLGVESDSGADVVRLRLPGGEELSIPRDEIVGAHLIHRWK